MIGVHVAQLLQAPIGTTRSFEFSERVPAIEEELGLRGPIAGQAKLLRTTNGILVDVAYRADLDQECGRCLGTAHVDVDRELSQEFFPSVNVYTGVPVPIGEPEEPRVRPDHILELTEVIRQDIVTQLPIRPLCRPECAGLCLICGQDLNAGHRGCDDEAEAEPAGGFGRLGELLKRELRS